MEKISAPIYYEYEKVTREFINEKDSDLLWRKVSTWDNYIKLDLDIQKGPTNSVTYDHFVVDGDISETLDELQAVVDFLADTVVELQEVKRNQASHPSL